MTRDDYERRERLIRDHMDAMQRFDESIAHHQRPTAQATHDVLRTYRKLQDLYCLEMS